MTKSDLIEKISFSQGQLSYRDVELCVKAIIEKMSERLSSGDRVEIRGFGSFCLHYRAPRMGRNPKTGATVFVENKNIPYFRMGKKLKERINSLNN